MLLQMQIVAWAIKVVLATRNQTTKSQGKRQRRCN